MTKKILRNKYKLVQRPTHGIIWEGFKHQVRTLWPNTRQNGQTVAYYWSDLGIFKPSYTDTEDPFITNGTCDACIWRVNQSVSTILKKSFHICLDIPFSTQ